MRHAPSDRPVTQKSGVACKGQHAHIMLGTAPHTPLRHLMRRLQLTPFWHDTPQMRRPRCRHQPPHHPASRARAAKPSQMQVVNATLMQQAPRMHRKVLGEGPRRHKAVQMRRFDAAADVDDAVAAADALRVSCFGVHMYTARFNRLPCTITNPRVMNSTQTCKLGRHIHMLHERKYWQPVDATVVMLLLLLLHLLLPPLLLLLLLATWRVNHRQWQEQ
jgi:hypothetical protein